MQKKVRKMHFILREKGAGGKLSAHHREVSAVSEVVQQLSGSVFSVLLV